MSRAALTRAAALLLWIAVFGGALAAQQTPAEALIEAGHWKRARDIVEARLREAPDDALEFPDGARRNAGEMFAWRGKLFFIDTGMSREIGDSAGAVLRIVHSPQSQAYAVCPNGKTTLLWDARRSDATARAKACGSK